MELTIKLQDQALVRFGARLAALGERANMAMSRALNHEGAKALTQVKRSLAKQSGMKYSDLSKLTHAVPSSPSTLTYQIRVSGKETNIAAFGGRQTAAGVSASPWGERHVFAGTFMVYAHAGEQGLSGIVAEGSALAFKRVGKGRLPIHPLYGPNIGREVLKGETREVFERAAPAVIERLGHEIQRLLK
jgi:hypothetical protein